MHTIEEHLNLPINTPKNRLDRNKNNDKSC